MLIQLVHRIHHRHVAVFLHHGRAGIRILRRGRRDREREAHQRCAQDKAELFIFSHVRFPLMFCNML